VGGDQALQRCRAQQWHVAGKQDDRARTPHERRFRLLQRMRGPELGRLHDELEVLVSREPASYCVGFMTDDERDGRRAQGARRSEDVLDHGPAGNRVQDLRETGLHSSPLTRGKDHDMRV
jgi:hypothetical protein